MWRTGMVLHHKGGIVSFKCLHFGLRGETSPLDYMEIINSLWPRSLLCLTNSSLLKYQTDSNHKGLYVFSTVFPPDGGQWNIMKKQMSSLFDFFLIYFCLLWFINSHISALPLLNGPTEGDLLCFFIMPQISQFLNTHIKTWPKIQIICPQHI